MHLRMLILLATATGLQAQSGTEYQLKAVYLSKLPQYVEWPAAAFADERAPIVIGVLGDDPFGDALNEAVKDEQAHNRPLVIKRANRLEDLKPCHLLFVCRSESKHLPEILQQLAGSGILTVGDTEQFSRLCGAISLALLERRVQFEINVAAARSEGLKISAQLLKLAKPATCPGLKDG